MVDGIRTQLDSFDLIGIYTRTTNQGGQAQIDIGRLWQRFLTENISNKIPGKISNDTYCVYTDYQSDLNGPYTTLIGCKVASSTSAPNGLTKMTIPGLNFLRIESKGILPDCVVHTWTDIWNSNIERAYLADFDVYGEGCADPQNATVDIYLSVK